MKFDNKTCIHDPNNSQNSLSKMPYYKMTNPQKYPFFCEYCKQCFEFIYDFKLKKWVDVI